MPFWHCLPCLRFQNDEVVTKLDHSNCALTDVPPDISQHERALEELILSSNRIRALPPQLFYCQGIRVLFVNDNELESLPGAIGSLRHLQNLNLSRNGLSTVPDNIRSCKNLTRLDLSLNNLQRLPDAITSLISLQELLLNETNLEFLPANFGRLVNLRILELRSNNLITLPKSMSRLSNLNRIDIGANEFTELPEVICQLSELRELWIDVNRIRRISANVSNLRELKHFEANNNLLITLPSEISNWLNLEVLSVSTNDIESLPFSIGMLKSLVTLQCEANQLRELPDSICHLENLEEMVISHNFILRLPTTIGMLRKLRFFCADENILRTLPLEICSCGNLAVLSVRSNKITELPQNIGHLVNLHVLNLVDNYITYLPVSVLNLTKLTALWISDNQSQPLVPLQYLNIASKTYLTCFMLPQQGSSQQNTAQTKDYTDNESSIFLYQQGEKKANSSENFIGRELQKSKTFSSDTGFIVHETSATAHSQSICFTDSEIVGDCTLIPQNVCVTSPSRRICFADEVKGAEALATRLMRSPTPYPKELRLMAKYVRNNRHDQMQQIHASYVDSTITAQNMRSVLASSASDQVGGQKYLSTSSLKVTDPVDEIKEARVLLNSGGSPGPLQQIQNSVSYHLIDHTVFDNLQLSKQQPIQMYPTSKSPNNMVNGQTNDSGPQLQPLLNSSIDVHVDRQTPTMYVSQPVLVTQQQCYIHFRDPYHQSASPHQTFQDQDYLYSPNICDGPLRNLLYENPESVHQLRTSPSIYSSCNQLGSQQTQHAILNVPIIKPPPYHIARAFTKKSREDLLSYDTMRNQINHGDSTGFNFDELDVAEVDDGNIEGGSEDCENELTNHRSYSVLNEHDAQLSSSMSDSMRGNVLNDNDYNSVDYKNNNSSSLNRTYSIECDDGLKKGPSLLSLQALENEYLNSGAEYRRALLLPIQRREWNAAGNGDNEVEIISDSAQETQHNSNSRSWQAAPRSNSATTWLFGLHKNPTVRQLTIKRDQSIGFEIQDKQNQGIFVSCTHPNTSAATLLHANDKLLEVNGYDFTKMRLVDAQQVLDNSGPVINVMISRT